MAVAGEWMSSDLAFQAVDLPLLFEFLLAVQNLSMTYLHLQLDFLHGRWR